MRKERVRRYVSADALATDIRRYLDGRPLEAAPESRTYLFRKFVRRHRVETIAGAAVFIALVAGLAGTISQAREAAIQRDAALAAQTSESEQRKLAEAQREEALRQKASAETNAAAAEVARARAEAITTFVTTTLRASDPYTMRDTGGATAGGRHDATILDAMQLALRDLDSGRFKDDPETEAALRTTIATILENNGRALEAEPLYRAALETYRSLFSGDNAHTADALSSLSKNLHTLGRPEAESLCLESLAMYRRLFTGDHAAIARGLSNLGLMLADLGRAAEGIPPLTESLPCASASTAGTTPTSPWVSATSPPSSAPAAAPTRPSRSPPVRSR
jgi:tetratricopeptide (TPR) repeat protein